ncbi:MAG TPA: hypothetical protein DD426_04530 [Clostridiaceae bacterium]|nr:hypothetical protein [Clostridiaceae bacterium]
MTKERFVKEFKGSEMLYDKNFKIYYKNDGSDCAEVIKESAEESLNNLVSDFDYRPKSSINIIIYPKYGEMEKMMALGTGSPATGAYYCGTVGVMESRNNSDKKKSLLVHELTHYVLDYKSNGNMPAWFTEGTALYEEYKVCRNEWAKGKDYEDYYTIKELEGNFYGLDEIKAYKQSFLIVKYIGEHYGMNGINRIIQELSKGKSTSQSIKTATGLNAVELFDHSLAYGRN